MTDENEDKPDKNIPTWDGNPSGWEQYLRKASLYIEGTERHKRYLCGPRLEGNLRHAAEAACIGKKIGWLGDMEGGWRLLRFLGGKLAKQAVPEVANHLENFFFHMISEPFCNERSLEGIFIL